MSEDVAAKPDATQIMFVSQGGQREAKAAIKWSYVYDGSGDTSKVSGWVSSSRDSWMDGKKESVRSVEAERVVSALALSTTPAVHQIIVIVDHRVPVSVLDGPSNAATSLHVLKSRGITHSCREYSDSSISPSSWTMSPSSTGMDVDIDMVDEEGPAST